MSRLRYNCPKSVDVIAKRYIDKVGSDADVFVLRGKDQISYSNLALAEEPDNERNSKQQ